MAAERRGPVAATAQNELLGAAFCKGKLSSSSKPHPLSALAQESSASPFRPGPALSILQSGAGLPLAPWALLLCWGFPAPESHSTQVLLRGQAGLGVLSPSSPRPRPCPLSQHGRSAPRPRPRDGPKRDSGCCILQRETLPAANHIPYLPWLMKAAQALFAPGPALSIGQSGAGLPLAPWALMLCWGSPAPETHSKWVLLRGQVGLGVLCASLSRPRPSPLSQHGR